MIGLARVRRNYAYLTEVFSIRLRCQPILAPLSVGSLAPGPFISKVRL